MLRDRGFSKVPIATSASRLFFNECRPAAVTDDELPIIAVHTRTSSRKPIGVVPGRRMGLFSNIFPSLILIVLVRNVDGVTIVLMSSPENYARRCLTCCIMIDKPVGTVEGVDPNLSDVRHVRLNLFI
ncbi:hypothetical protein Zmor_021842 [Zophobas morio]|uniref:Uncharacterized protein n=1 Tax=Zophobas morio TaxID=2755281 RepID=A0AA38I768_9CUCU|nr:hypothetical protein Zmor_021842 [Zophobas morio]